MQQIVFRPVLTKPTKIFYNKPVREGVARLFNRRIRHRGFCVLSEKDKKPGCGTFVYALMNILDDARLLVF